MSTFLSHSGTRAYRVLRFFAVPAFWTLTVTIFVNDNLFEFNGVRGPSMAPTLSPKWHETGERDFVLVSKWSPTRNLRRGDVVSFWNPSEQRSLNIKRVIGLEGDWVELDSRRRPRDNKHGGGVGSGESWDMMIEANGGVLERTGKRGIRVPFGHVWVEGDNWRESVDSNYVGPISKTLIQGKAVCVLWPPSKSWSKPWEGFKGRTRVKEGKVAVPPGWEDL